MSTIELEEYKYTKTHEWVVVEDDIATIGISDFAQGSLGDVVYIELPVVGDHYDAGDDVSVVESVKAASDIYSPLSGEIIKVNDALIDNPGMINSSAETSGWIYRIRLNNPDEIMELLSEDDYKKILD